MSQSLEGKIALVTGASRGLGRASAQRFARDGATVLAHYGSSKGDADSLVAEIEAAGGRVELLQADLSTADGVAQLVAATKDALGDRSLDILFNNAGVAEFVDFADTDAETLDRQYAVNVRAPFLLSQGLADRIADGGSILFTSSIVAKTYFDGVPAYSITKGAVDTLVRHLAALFGPRGIRVNAVAPGAIDTDMSAWLRSEEGAANAKSIQALQRVGRPDDIAGVAAFLASNDAGWVTGQVLDASGGSKL